LHLATAEWVAALSIQNSAAAVDEDAIDA